MANPRQQYIDRRKTAPKYTPTKPSTAKNIASTALSLSPTAYKILRAYAQKQGISVGELLKNTYGDVIDSVLNVINPDGSTDIVDVARNAFDSFKDKFTNTPTQTATNTTLGNHNVDASGGFDALATQNNPASSVGTPTSYYNGMGSNSLPSPRYNPAGGTGRMYGMGGGPGSMQVGALGSSASMGGGAGATAVGHPGMGMAAGSAPQGFLGGLGAGINAMGPAAIMMTAAKTLYNAYRRPTTQETFSNRLAQNQATGYGGSPWGYTGAASSLNTFDSAGNPRTPRMPQYGGMTNNRTDGTSGFENSMMGPSATNLADLTTYKGGRASSGEAAQPFDVYNEGGKDYVKVGPNNPLYKRMGLTNPTGGGVALNRYGREQLAYRNEMSDKAGENRGR